MGKPRRLAAPLLACPDGREAVQPEIGIAPAATDRRPDSPPFPTRGDVASGRTQNVRFHVFLGFLKSHCSRVIDVLAMQYAL